MDAIFIKLEDRFGVVLGGLLSIGLISLVLESVVGVLTAIIYGILVASGLV